MMHYSTGIFNIGKDLHLNTLFNFTGNDTMHWPEIRRSQTYGGGYITTD